MRGVHLVVAALLACAAAAQSYEYFLNSYTATLPHGCQVATLADFQSAEFAAQYNKNGYLSVKSPIPSTVDCGVDVLSAPGGTPGRLAPNEGAGFVVTFKPKTGPYEGCGTINYTDTIALGTSLDDGNLLWTTITPEIQNQTILGSFYSPGSVALLKCEAAPASQFYLSAYVSIPEGCTVATWADFTSDAFMAQYNAGGYLPVKGGAIPASTDCGIDVLATAGGQPGRIGFTNGSDFLLTYPPHSGPYEGCGGAAYTDKIALGTEATNVAYATLTKDIVSTMGVESFLTPGSVAIINCGGAAPTPAPTPAPAAAEFYLSAYVSIPEGCEVATFDDFKSDAFVAQYNSVGYLSVKGGAIPEATDCGIDVLPTAGGAPGRLQLNNGSYDFLLTYPPHSGPYEGCGTAPYTDKIAFGTELANVAWPKLTPAILSVLSVESFYSPGSVALIKCGASPPPGPTTPSPVGTGSFALANYNATYVPPHCSVVTLEQAQSPLFADYYNIHGYLDVIGTIVPNTDCGIDVLTAAGGTPGRILTSGDFVSTYNPDGSWECNGAPFTTRISLGPNLGADPLGRWKTINQTIQNTFTVGSFYPPGSVALLYCEEGAQSRWSARGAH